MWNQVTGGPDTEHDGTPSLWDSSLNTQSCWRLTWKSRTRSDSTDRPRTAQPLCWEALASSADPSPDSLLWEAEVRSEQLPLQNALMNFSFYKSPAPTCTSLSAPLCRTGTCSAEAETWSPTLLECSSWADEGPPAGWRICRGFRGLKSWTGASLLHWALLIIHQRTVHLKQQHWKAANAVQEAFCQDAESSEEGEKKCEFSKTSQPFFAVIH